MPSLLIRLLLCLSSYFPLTAIFAVQFYFKADRWAAIAVLALGVVGLAGISIYLWAVRRLATITVQIDAVSKKDEDAMSYIVSYLLPFIALPSGNWADGLSLCIFLFVLVVLYIHSNMLHINPMLNLAGWHVYEVTLDGGDTKTLISRRRLRKGSQAKVVQMADDLLLEADS